MSQDFENRPIYEEYRMAALVWRCLLGLAPAYLVEFCGHTQSARSSLSLPSADQSLLRLETNDNYDGRVTVIIVSFKVVSISAPSRLPSPERPLAQSRSKRVV